MKGTGLQKSDFTQSGFGCIHYGQIYTKYGVHADKTLSFIPPETYERLRHASPGDLLIATTSENDEDLCKAVAWLGDAEIAFSGDMCSYTHGMNPKYVSYFFGTTDFSSQKQRFITGTKVRRIAPQSLEKVKIPVPPLEEQERIVAVLDKFDALVNDISSGLPAEIEARRKQYEYYRDKLLSFEEAQ
ncbi:MAG: restriction endonuclease subunit S [Actinomyces sp.]|nr:restriction endonuclease subunit S [Actinomyces sp.]